MPSSILPHLLLLTVGLHSLSWFHRGSSSANHPQRYPIPDQICSFLEERLSGCESDMHALFPDVSLQALLS